MKAKIVSVVLLVAVFLSVAGCASKSELDAANVKVLELTEANATLRSEKTALEAEVKDLNTQLGDLGTIKNQLTGAQKDLDNWGEILCQDHTWDEMWNDVIVNWPLVDSGVDPYFETMISLTQWSTDPDWQIDQTKPISVLIFDREYDTSFVIDGTKNCLYVNPEVYPFFGQ